MVAALGISQMKKLEKVIKMRREIAAQLSKNLSCIDEIEIPKEPAGFRHTYQMYTIRVKAGLKKREELREHLSKRGITVKVYFDPVHLSHFYRERMGYQRGLLPVTEETSDTVLTLPIYPTMTNDERGYLIESVIEFFA